MKHESKQREEYDCPLSVCPRTFDTEQSAKDHCRSIHRIAPETISEFNRSYEKRKGRRRLSPDVLGTAVNFDYIVCRRCGKCEARPERRLGDFDVFFCSSDCQSKYFTGPRHPAWKETTRSGAYGPHWQEKRAERIARDEHQCVVCGISRDEHYRRYRADLHVHHIVPRREFTSDDGTDWERANQLSNLVTLCNSCHPKHEEKPPAFFESVTQSA